jgi:hypothetical protein
MYELTLILSILILGYVVNIVYKEDELLVIPHNDKTHDIIFRCASISSVLIIIYTIIYKGLKTGLLLFLFTWCFFVVLTPIPEAAILLTVPIKYITKLPLEEAQIYVSIFATLIIYLFYTLGSHIVKNTVINGLFNYIMNNKLYHMILLSIASSIIISKFVNDTIDAYTHKDKIFLLNDANKNLSVVAFISIFIYFQTIYKYNIEIGY